MKLTKQELERKIVDTEITYIDSSYFEGSVEDVVKRLRKFKKDHSGKHKDCFIKEVEESDYGDCCSRKVFYLMTKLPESDVIYKMRIKMIKETKERQASYDKQNYERLKKIYGD